MNQKEFTRKPHTPTSEAAQAAEAYMSDQEFTARLAKLIPSPSEAVNSRLLDFANSLWFGLKEDLFHTFLFISHHFTPEVLQSVYPCLWLHDHRAGDSCRL